MCSSDLGLKGSTDGAGTVARFNNPSDVAVDGSGNVYVSDFNNHKIRKISTAGVVTTLAGSGLIGSDDGTGTAASFHNPMGIALDKTGNIYVADWRNHKIRKITASGEVTTLAGSGSSGFTDGVGTAARFNLPVGIAVDGSGNVYVADTGNHRIRKISGGSVLTGTAPNEAGTHNVTLIANDGNILEHAIKFDGSNNTYNGVLPTQAIGERYDIIIDFSKYNVGDKLYMVNILEHDTGKKPKTLARDKVQSFLNEVVSGEYNPQSD